MQIDLWRYACARYQDPRIADYCLAAQDQGANVCLMLCAAWLDAQAIAFDPVLAERLSRLAEARHSQLIEPLRTLRNTWRQDALNDAFVAQLRESIKALELTAERELLETLERLCTPKPLSPHKQTLWLEALSQPVTWSAQELLHWQQPLADPA